MKKCAMMLMIFLQSILLVACSAADIRDISKLDTNIADDGGTPADEPTEKDDGIMYMTVQELYSYFTDVDITPDNWQDYFEIKEEEWSQTDAFGEVISTETNYIVAVKENIYVIGNNKVVMRFSLTGSGRSFGELGATEIDVECYDSGTGFLLSKQRDAEEFNEIADCTVIKTIGYVTVSTLPDDMWNEDTDGKKYIALEVSEDKIYCLYANGDKIYRYADGREDGAGAGRGERDGTDIHALDGWDWNDFFNMLDSNGYGRAEHTSSN